MSGGEAKMLAVARGLMSNADFLCIDEPSLGLQPSLRFELFATIREINKQGKTVLLVEQNIPQIAETGRQDLCHGGRAASHLKAARTRP